MRFRTIFGLLMITAVGCALAWVFRRAQPAAPLQTSNQFGSESLFGTSGSSRGQIVPLAVGDSFSATAFIGAQSSEDSTAPETNRQERRLTQIASIARQPSESAATPQLETAFPGPLDMLGIQRMPTEVPIGSPVANQFTPIVKIEPVETVPSKRVVTVGRPNYEETPNSHTRRKPTPTHRIVDGDTLPKLAERYLGDASRGVEIFNANRDKLSSPELLPIGAEIALPDSLRRLPKVGVGR